MNNIIINGDCTVELEKLEKETFDIIICDPPVLDLELERSNYNMDKKGTKNKIKGDKIKDFYKQKKKEYKTFCDKWILQCIRLLKPKGVLIIYNETNDIYIDEDIMFSEYGILNIRPLAWENNNKSVYNMNTWQPSVTPMYYCYKNKPKFNNNLRINGKLPRADFHIPLSLGKASYEDLGICEYQKPLELCDILIRAYRIKGKSEGMKLLVPFAGVGSECVAAKNLGITYLGFDINQTFINVANNRLSHINNCKELSGKQLKEHFKNFIRKIKN